MSDEQDLKLACLHQAGGNLDHAKSLFDWVSGSVRATPQSEAPAVSAPNQDKPEQPFNYQHPSKYGTDVPRRCYLEELTPEERAIRDLVGAIEHLGAHPLLTTTVIQLMKAGESLADWVDIGLRDKAIAALTSEPETHTGGGRVGALLDEGQQETAPVQSASDQDKDPRLVAIQNANRCDSSVCADMQDDNCVCGIEYRALLSAVQLHDAAEQLPHKGVRLPDANGPNSAEWSARNQQNFKLPEGFTKWQDNTQQNPARWPQGSTALTVYEAIQFPTFAGGGIRYRDDIDWEFTYAYRFVREDKNDERTSDESQATDQDRVEPLIPPSAEAERTEAQSQAEPVIEQEPEDESTPVLDALAQADIAMSQPAIEEPEPLQNGDASVFAHGILRDFDEPEARRFDLSRLFGKKTVDA